MKVALVHDYLIRFGGAERVVLALRKIFPRAPIYTLLYDQKKMGRYFEGADIRTSFCQKFPRFWRRHHRTLLPFLPAAVESLDLSNFDLVISSCNSFAKGLILRTKTTHICYCHSPTRFLWDYTHQYQSACPSLRKMFFHFFRLWDKAAANRVDYFLANSKTTAARIKKYYGRGAKVIYPGVSLRARQCGFWNARPTSGHGSAGRLEQLLQPTRGERGGLASKFSSLGKIYASRSHLPSLQYPEYYLIVSQLTPHKRLDIAIQAFNKLELPLVIIGQGRDERRLKRLAKKNIKFLGWQPDEIVSQYYQNCTAFILPAQEDFGLGPVEAMSFGKPVLAYGQGGATETVIEGMTGEFFDYPAPEALADGVRRLRQNLRNYSPLVIRKRAEKFSTERFEREIKDFIKHLSVKAS